MNSLGVIECLTVSEEAAASRTSEARLAGQIRLLIKSIDLIH